MIMNENYEDVGEDDNSVYEEANLENGNGGDNISYNLYAISNHSGTLHGGHYTAYCRHPFNGFDEEGRQVGPRKLAPI